MDIQLRSGLLDLFTNRYSGRNAMVPYEKGSGYAPYVGGLLAEFMGAGSVVSSSIVGAIYLVALGVDYHDARLALSKNHPSHPLQLKRWSITPSGLPLERFTEVLVRSMALLRKRPKPTIIRPM